MWSSSITDLPKDIVLNILCSLPTKTIIQCKQVCKEWCDIILDPRFAEAHYNYNSSRLSLVCFRNGFSLIQDGSIYLIEGYKQHHSYKVVSSKFIQTPTGFTIVVKNSCRGFILLSTLFPGIGLGNDVYNPLTKECFQGPPVLAEGSEIMVGLGFGPVTNQYKIVKLVMENNACDFGVHTVGIDHCHVWRRVETNKLVCMEGLGRQSLYLNGVLHWPITLAKQEKIACFDVDNEEFNTMALPFLQNSTKFINSIGNIHGLLCVGINVMDNPGFQTEMWVMSEYGVINSWNIYVVLNNNYDIVGDNKLLSFDRPQLADVLDNKELVILTRDLPQFHLFSYNQKARNSTSLTIGADIDERSDTSAEIYVPSFFTMGSSMKNQVSYFL